MLDTTERQNKMNRNDFIGKMCVVRTYGAGVWYGILESLEGKGGVVSNAKRIHHWNGAASLSELSVRGVTNIRGETRIPCAVKQVLLTEIIEVIPMTEEAVKNHGR